MAYDMKGYEKEDGDQNAMLRQHARAGDATKHTSSDRRYSGIRCLCQSGVQESGPKAVHVIHLLNRNSTQAILDSMQDYLAPSTPLYITHNLSH